MSKAPSMPMYWDAYLADTTHLTTEEHGAYLLLLAAMWRRNGAVPDCDQDNARILGLTQAKWRKIKARLLQTIDGFQVSDGLITQKKLREIWENTQEKIDKNRSNGALGGRAKANRNNTKALANGSNSLKRKATIPEPEPEPDSLTPLYSPLGEDGANELAGTEGGDDGAAIDDATGAKKATKRSRAGAGKRAIAEHAEPDQRDIEHADKHGIDWRQQWPQFRDWHIRQETRTTDRGWRASWRTWCRKALEFADRDGPAGAARGNGRRMDWNEAARIAMAERANAQAVDLDDWPEWLTNDEAPIDPPALRIVAGNSGRA